MRKICAEQLKRLPSNLPGKPETDSDRRTYVDVFEKYTKSEAHAKAVIDELIESSEFYPKIPELIATCKRIAASMSVLPPGCDICDGDSWVTSSDGLKRCICERGQYLRECDRKRVSEGHQEPRSSELKKATKPSQIQ